MPPSETYKSEIGSQPTMCQVHTDAYVSLLAPGKTTIPLATQERLPRIVRRSTYHYAYARQTQVNWKKETNKIKNNKEKARQKCEKRKRRGKTRKDNMRKQGKEKSKHVILADPRN